MRLLDPAAGSPGYLISVNVRQTSVKSQLDRTLGNAVV